MKKTQFTSPMILIFLIITYFIISFEISATQSHLTKSRTSLLKITNDIKAIEEMDLEWKANITKTALNLLSRNNSSGTINQELTELNAEIYELNNIKAMNYTKKYYYNNFSKEIIGTILVPYPHASFAQSEENIRLHCQEITKECIEENLHNPDITAEIIETTILLSNANYPLSLIYKYVIE
ncbi:MAG: hypothetical protein PHT91_04060 [Candidatus Nanoarchaeia archaeon]|nr:hypothetical protein [Candidatus Nanoarchaeia archaeon]MDD5054280.1 hypothetical protein [Candidatus Nanoarchaeia archaeon]MDD5500019.1 hypothetical protein [Candidatus Nanoarchaeia archaeon]